MNENTQKIFRVLPPSIGSQFLKYILASEQRDVISEVVDEDIISNIQSKIPKEIVETIVSQKKNTRAKKAQE